MLRRKLFNVHKKNPHNFERHGSLIEKLLQPMAGIPFLREKSNKVKYV